MRSVLAAALAAVIFALAAIGSDAQQIAASNSASLSGLGLVVVRNLSNQSTCSTTITGNGVGTVTFEGAGNSPTGDNSALSGALLDTGTYSAISSNPYGGGTAATTATSNGLYESPVAGLTAFRARISSYTSGLFAISISCSTGVFAPPASVSGGSGGGTYTAPPLQAVSLPTSFQTSFPTPPPFPSVQPVSLPTGFQSSFPTPNPNSVAAQNTSAAAGAPSSALFTCTATLRHLYGVTVAIPTGATAATTLTDGSGGALLAAIPANFPGGEIQLLAPHFCGTSVYENSSATSPAFTISVGP